MIETSALGPKIFLITGEPSGDQLAADLMAGLKAEARARGLAEPRFTGVGGERMTARGLELILPMGAFAVMGLLEVLPRALAIKRHIRHLADEIIRQNPDVIVTVDSWGFTGRLNARLKALGSKIPRVHYVAPMVWVWKQNRARDVAARVDRLLTLWPFEAKHFEPLGLDCVHVGHSVVSSGADQGNGLAFRQRHSIPEDADLLVVLPGSRVGEVTRLLPVFGAVVAQLAQDPAQKNLHVAIPTLAHLRDKVDEATQGWPAKILLLDGEQEKYDAYAAARGALAASGTVTLELALAGLPHVIAYRLNALTYMIFRRLNKAPFVNLINILLGRAVVPELIQGECAPEPIVTALTPLLRDQTARDAQQAAFAEASTKLAGPPGSGGKADPARTAAQAVWELITPNG
ncbi:MAG: lipid-A-disaccharide synthase [Rhodospirillaceae bacterium]